jgi:hypothetical protein
MNKIDRWGYVLRFGCLGRFVGSLLLHRIITGRNSWTSTAASSAAAVTYINTTTTEETGTVIVIIVFVGIIRDGISGFRVKVMGESWGWGCCVAMLRIIVIVAAVHVGKCTGDSLFGFVLHLLYSSVFDCSKKP